MPSPSALALVSAQVLGEAMEWFESYYARVHRLFGSRQRRLCLEAQEAEPVFAAFWSEAARLHAWSGPLQLLSTS